MLTTASVACVCLSTACRSPTKGGATAFPLANATAKPEPQHGQAAQGAEQAGEQHVQAEEHAGLTGQQASRDGSVGISRRRLLQHQRAVEVPAYCTEGAALQLAPPPGSAVLFW